MKTTLNKTLRCVFTFSFFVLILSGCEDILFNNGNPISADTRVTPDNLINTNNVGGYFDNYLLYCTFEGDAIGSQPNKTLPGLPSGDELKYEDGTGILVLYSGPQKSIILPSFGLSQPKQKIEFVSKPGSGEEIITATWSGQLTGHIFKDSNINDNVPGTFYGLKYITITYGIGDTLVRSYIAGNGITTLFKNDNGDNQASWGYSDIFPLQPGSSPNTWIPISSQHTFTITCNLETNTFNLKLIKDDGTIITGFDLPFFEDYTPIRNPIFKIKIGVGSFAPNGYILDNATIKQTPFIGPINPPF